MADWASIKVVARWVAWFALMFSPIAACHLATHTPWLVPNLTTATPLPAAMTRP